jgi:uncharacterized protein YcbK (DUF882 family)
VALSAIGAATAPSTERTTTIRADDSTNADAFAGIPSSAVHAHKAEHKAVPKKAEGTSELERDDQANDDADTGNIGSTSASLKSAKEPGPNDIVRSISALDPELQAKLARIAARVQNETGHTVTVTETYRTQERQNALYAQGRYTGGQVVTWTQNSKHTQGRAVDVALDNGTASPDAYTALQRIANEEGLRTLGPRDPGHLELRGTGANAGDSTPTLPAEPADATGPGQVSIARLAQVARVADVRSTPTARVATVSQPAQPATMRIHGNPKGDASSSFERGSSDRGSRGDGQSGSRGAAYAALSPTMAVHDASPSAPIHATTATAGSDAVARTEKILAALDSAPARQLSQITMNVDGANGTTDRVHVALRGTALNTTIDTSDNRVAQLLNARTEELSKALSRDGIELRELRVRAAAETNTVTATAAGQNAQAGADSSTQSRFDRGNAWSRQQDQQERQRSQQDRGRQQQRQRRGGEQ